MRYVVCVSDNMSQDRCKLLKRLIAREHDEALMRFRWEPIP